MDSNDRGSTTARSRFRKIAIDLTPLRVSRDFRLLWAGGFVSELGYQFARVAIYIQVYALTGSPVAVGQAVWQTVSIVGPGVGGFVIREFGLSWAYGIDMVTYGALFGAALAMRPMPPEHDPNGAVGWGAVKEGFGFVRGSRLIRSTFVIDLIAMIFGSPLALFPILAVTQLHRGSEVVG